MLSTRLIIRSLLKMEIISEMFVFLRRPLLWQDAVGCWPLAAEGAQCPELRPQEGSQGWAGLCVYGQGVPRGALHIRANMLEGVNQHSGIDFS